MAKKDKPTRLSKPALDPFTETAHQLAAPAYQDAFRPFAQQVGKAGATLGGVVNLLLSPVAVTVYAYQQATPHIKKKISDAVEKRLADVPPENITAPSPRIAVPILQSLVHASDEPEIADMFANLLASSMNVDTATNVHPSFVEVVNSLTADEAILLRAFCSADLYPLIDVQLHTVTGTGYSVILKNFTLLTSMGTYKRPDLMGSYIDNISRLGLTEIPPMVSFSDAQRYAELDEHPQVAAIKSATEAHEGNRIVIEHKVIRLTSYGKQFMNAAVRDKQ